MVGPGGTQQAIRHRLPSMHWLRAERWASGAAGSGSEARADAVSRQLQADVRPRRAPMPCVPSPGFVTPSRSTTLVYPLTQSRRAGHGGS
jgi:hypothetical protein